MFNYSYQNRDWLAVYVDELGDRQIMPFNSYEDALKYLEVCDCKIGVMTTSFYDRFVEHVAVKVLEYKNIEGGDVMCLNM